MPAVSDYRALISGGSWFAEETFGKPIILTFSFNEAPPSYLNPTYSAASSSFASLSASERDVVRGALQAWSAVSGVTFIETKYHQGDITFSFANLAAFSQQGAAGIAFGPSASYYNKSDGSHGIFASKDFLGGDIFFDNNYRASPAFSGDFRHVALHEIGHSLGLKHPFDTTLAHTETLTSEADTGANTVMSYDQRLRSNNLGPLDVAAAQYYYGPAVERNNAFPLWGFDPSTERFEAHGTAAAEMIRGTGTDDLIYSEGGRDLISTAQGNDTVIALGQSIEFDGGSGLDTIVTGFKLNKLSDIIGSGTTRYIYREGGTEVLANVERLAFTNAYVALDVEGNAGQAYRLYQAALNRVPDAAGLSWHVRRLDFGTSLHDDAANFLASPEFTQRYGSSTSGEAFVTALYANVLDRAPDPTGQAYWLGNLAGGMDRAAVLVGFSESPENHARVDPKIAAGIYLDYMVMA